MKDRVPLYPGRVKLTPVSGQENTYDMVRADEPTQEGDPLSKATFLKDATVAMFGLGTDSVPDDVFKNLSTLGPMDNFVTERIKSSKNWTAPKSRMQKFVVFAVGGGGAGSAHGGGGSGYIAKAVLTIQQNTNISVVCGAGASVLGAQGGTTTFGDLLTAIGGYGGGDDNSGGNGEAGGGAGIYGGIGGGNGNVYGGGGGGAWTGKGGNGGLYGGAGGGGGAENAAGGTGGALGGNEAQEGTPVLLPSSFNCISFTSVGKPGTGTHGGGGGYGGNGGNNTSNGGGGGGGFFGNGGNGVFTYGAGGGGGGFCGNGGNGVTARLSGNDSGFGGGGGGFFCNGAAGSADGGGGGGGFFSDANGIVGGDGGVLIAYFKED